MGRKKISITRLTDERNRQITFSKRKAGLLKKAYELSILCDVEIAVIMITSNNKLYQYASSNMNSILIRYTDFKDPDENKTNADILDDITKKEKGGGGQDDSGDEESSSQQSFMITPRTQESFRRIGKEFDTLLRTNQVPQNQSLPRAAAGVPASTPLGSAPPNIPSVMPVTVPVGYSPNNVQQQIQQHLQNQLDSQKSSSTSAGLSSAPLTSGSTGSLFSPQSELSSSSPMASGRSHRSPTNMPPPLTTPTRLQTLRNQTLKLHLPGSGRNYISLPTSASGSGSGAGEGNLSKKAGGGGGGGGGEGEESEEGKDGAEGAHSGAKPQLRVYIPGQKEFVPKTQDASPLPQVNLTTQPAGGGAVGVSSTSTHVTTTTTESLTTPVLSLTTPNIFSSLPPIFSSLIGDFPFGPTSAGVGTGTGSAAIGGGGGGGAAVGGASSTTGDGDKSSAALVAFPVSIQPSATGGSGAGNLILQAQNMGQPFLLTPTYDSRQNPLFSSQGYTPPTSGLPAGLSPNIGGFQNLEQLKQQYEMTQQMIQQQLLYSKMQMLQQQQGKEGGRAEEGVAGGGGASVANTTTSSTAHHTRGAEEAGGVSRLGTRSSAADEGSSQYLNGSDVMMGLHASQTQSRTVSRPHPHGDDRPPEKKARLDTSDSIQ